MAGNADAIARIGWDNSDAQRGARDFLRLTDQTSKAFNKVWDGAKFGAGFLGIGSAIPLIGKLVQQIKDGFDFNVEMSDAEAGIANVLRRFDGLNRVAAKNEAAKAMQMIADLEPVTAGGLQDLVGGFMGTVAAAKAVGLTTEQNIQLVSKFANALANAGLPVDQLRQEMASILSGNITSDSQLAKILGITNEEVNAIKSRGGDLFAYLISKVTVFGEAGDSASVVFSSFDSARKKFMGASMKGAFEEIIELARDLTSVLEDMTGAAESSGNRLAHWLYVTRVGFKEFINEADDAGVWGGLNEMLKTLQGFGGLNAEDIDLGRIYDEAQKVQAKITELEVQASNPELKEEKRLEILKQVKKLREDELAIEDEAARLRKEENMALVESYRKARENIGMREESTGPSKPAATYVDQRDQAEELWREEQKLREMQRKSLMESLPLNEQIVRLVQEIADKRRDIALLPLTNEAERVKMQQELVELVSEEQRLRGQLRQDAEQTRKEAQERAEAEAELALRQSESLEEYQQQMQILREQIAGHDEKAKQLERELQIQREAKMLQEQMGLSEADALRMARERADLEDKANKKRNNSRYDEEGRRKSDGRKRIVTRPRDEPMPFDSIPTPSGLDEFYRKNKPGAPGLNDTFRFPGLDEMNKRGPLRDTFNFPGLDAFDQMQNKDNPLEDKARQNNAEKDQSNPTVSAAQQVIQKMDLIITALS